MSKATTEESARVALVLAGGGARGAYEAGVLSWILGPLRRRLGRCVCFDVFTGTSVGAVNACYLAATVDRADSPQRLTEIWGSLSLESVFRVNAGSLIRRGLRALGVARGAPVHQAMPARLEGLLDTAPLERLVLESIPWSRIHAHVRQKRIAAVAVTTTEIATGRSVVFVESRGAAGLPWRGDPFLVARAARLMPEHVLASAAIPLLFPAVRLGRGYHCDGGLRLNTPLKPALHLGATHVVIVGLRCSAPPRAESEEARLRTEAYGSLPYLAGKALDALLLDRIETDVERLHLFNELLSEGCRAYGPSFLQRINEPIVRRRGRAYRVVRDVFVRPSEDLGRMAAACLRQRRPPGRLRGLWNRLVAHYAASGDADLLSYLFFDRCYAHSLMELGRADAARYEEDLARLFLDAEQRREPAPGPGALEDSRRTAS